MRACSGDAHGPSAPENVHISSRAPSLLVEAAPSGSPIFSLRAIDRRSEGGGNANRGWSGRRDEASYWPAAGVGEGVGDINPFATCSPASFAPVSATELVLGFGMSATTAGHAEMQAHPRMTATSNRGA